MIKDISLSIESKQFGFKIYRKFTPVSYSLYRMILEWDL